MPEVRTTNLRFNLGKESQRKAWQYLQTMDKSAFKSYSQAVATAVLDWREAWADAVNRALEEKQQSARVTHLSHAALGLDEQPTVHEGSQARSLELQGIKADRCELNRQIRADNKLLRELKAQLAKLSKVVENTVEHIAETLERLRSSLIMLQYRLLVNRKRADTWKRQVNYYRPILQDYHAVTQQLADKKSEQENLQVNRNVLSPLQINQRRQLAEQIAALTEEIEELRSRQAMILQTSTARTTAKPSALAVIWTNWKKCRRNWPHKGKSIHSSFLSAQNSTLKLRMRSMRKMRLLFTNSVLLYDQSSRLNENRHCSTKAVSMMQPYSSLNSL